MTSKKEGYDFNTHHILIEDTVHQLDDIEILQLVDSILEEIKIEDIITEGIEKSLFKKSEKSGFTYGTLREVFLRGIENHKNSSTTLTETQYAFGRVNSFISGGRARDEDQDLLNEASRIPWNEGDLKKKILKDLSPFLKTEAPLTRILSILKKYEQKYLFKVSVKKHSGVDEGDYSIWGSCDSDIDEKRFSEGETKMPIELDFYINSKNKPVAMTREGAEQLAFSVVETLSHEWIHLSQNRARQWKTSGDTKKRYLYKIENKKVGSYLADDDEIEAHSKNIAASALRKFGSADRAIQFFKRPKFGVIPEHHFDMYLKIFGDFNHPVIKRLFKKIVYFLERG